MAENPLLPDAELRALYALLQAVSRGKGLGRNTNSDVAKAAGPKRPGCEALLTGTLLQLRPGDIVVSEGSFAVASVLAQPTLLARHGADVISRFQASSGDALLLQATALAEAQRRLAREGVVLAVAFAGTSIPSWGEALAWAQQESLPLIVVCADPSGSAAFRTEPPASPEAFTWTALQKPANRWKLPVLSVDGADSVAVYRVMQESALRARTGGGPAVLWAALPDAAAGSDPKLPVDPPPLKRLAHYLKVRGIAPRS